MTVTSEGYPFILAAIAVGVLLLRWNLYSGVFFLVLSLFFVWFFRLPDRVLPAGDVVVSPADGRVVEVSGAELDGVPCTRIGIFMSVFDVHVNFAPVAGAVESVTHVDGKLLPAFRPKVSDLNEHVDLVLGGSEAGRIQVRQIAGLLARRIVSYCRPGLRLEKGDRIGLIKFGSRVDVWLPADRVRVEVAVGQTVRGRSSVLGTIVKNP